MISAQASRLNNNNGNSGKVSQRDLETLAEWCDRVNNLVWPLWCTDSYIKRPLNQDGQQSTDDATVGLLDLSA